MEDRHDGGPRHGTSADECAQPANRSSHPRERLLFLDGLRAVAACYVVVSHCWSTVFPVALAAPPAILLTTAWMGFGRLAVALFIVVSGFSLGLVYWRHDATWPGGPWRFLAGRCRRILPPYWAAIGVGCLAGTTFLAVPGGTLWDGAIPTRVSGVIVHVLLLQDVVWAGPAGSTAFWSLAIEWHIYLAFAVALVVGFARSRRAPVLVVLCYVLVVVSELGQGYAPPVVGSLSLGLYAQFAFGFVVARAHVVETVSARRRIRRQLWCGAGIGVLAAAAVTLRHPDPVAPVHDLWFGPLCALGLLALSRPEEARGRLAGVARRVLERPRLVVLGTMSYSLYLTHAFVIETTWRFLVPPAGLGPFASLALQAGAGLVASIVVAAAFYALVERRFVSKGQSRANDRARASLMARLAGTGQRFGRVLSQARRD